MTFHRSPTSNNVLWISKSATNKRLLHSNGLSLAVTFPFCSQNFNPDRPPLPPNKYVTVITVQSTKLRPVGGFCAETAGALTLFGTALAGIPVSTTHTITGAIVGVGAVHRLSAVRWGVAGRIIWAWIFTIPASALIAAATYFLMNKLA